MVSVPLGFTDTANTTCLHVPSIGLIVAGDAAYNGDHLHLSESPDQRKRQEWIAALDKMESLKPRAVIAGHKRPGNNDSPTLDHARRVSPEVGLFVSETWAPSQQRSGTRKSRPLFPYGNILGFLVTISSIIPVR